MSGTCKTPRNGMLGAGKPGQADTSNIPLLLLLGSLCPVPCWEPTAQLPFGNGIGLPSLFFHLHWAFSTLQSPSLRKGEPPHRQADTGGLPEAEGVRQGFPEETRAGRRCEPETEGALPAEAWAGASDSRGGGSR